MPDTQQFRWELELPLPRAAAWAFVSDTERINRLAGLFPVEYQYVPQESGGSLIHGRAKTRGMTLRWIERPCQWSEPDFFTFTRDYQSGPMRQLISNCQFADGRTQGHTRLTQTMVVTPRGWLGSWIVKWSLREVEAGFRKAYATAADWYANRGQFAAIGSERPRLSEAARLAIESQLLPLADKLGVREVGRQFHAFLNTQPDSMVATLFPYKLADQWRLSRRAVLEFCLHATRDGLFNMRWNLICPACRVSTSTLPTLSDLKTTGHCEACNLNYTADFDRTVEVTFSPEPMGIGKLARIYCQSGPRNTPHRIAGAVVPPGASQTFTAKPDAGMHNLMSFQTRGGTLCEFAEEPGLPDRATCELTPNGIVGLPRRMKKGAVALELVNRTTAPAEVLLERSAWADDSATAADVTALAEFRKHFGTEVLAPGAEFGISNLTFLFSDLVGSAALYSEIGDAIAFSLVRDHFHLVEHIFEQRDGTLVKTIGDAVMAVFRRPEDAVAAAIDMHRRIPTVQKPALPTQLRLRIGLHRGPCIAVSANGRLDYFGTTVNAASRIQHIAEGGELLISDGTLQSGALRDWLAPLAETARRETIKLKGIPEPVAVCRLRVDPATDYRLEMLAAREEK